MIVHRNATPVELSLVLDWAAAEGWNPGLDDAKAFFASDPGGFFVAVDGETPIAAISVVNHSDVFSFLGLYIALPDVRGHGIGLRLWDHAIRHAGDRTIGLDGVPEQQANYAASGFVRAGGTTRFAGTVAAAEASTVRLARQEHIPNLVAREADVSGVKKTNYLSNWLAGTGNRTTIVDETNHGLTGFCTVRRCRRGAKIGPLLARDADTATRLVGHAATISGPDIIIDVPDRSAVLADVCQGFGLDPGFQTARMYSGTAPAASDAIYAVTSLELG